MIIVIQLFVTGFILLLLQKIVCLLAIYYILAYNLLYRQVHDFKIKN